MIIVMAALAAALVSGQPVDSAGAAANAGVRIIPPGTVGQAETLGIVGPRLTAAGGAGSAQAMTGRYYVSGDAGTAYSISQILTVERPSAARPDAAPVRSSSSFGFIPASGRVELPVRADFQVPRGVSPEAGGVLRVVTAYD